MSRLIAFLCAALLLCALAQPALAQCPGAVNSSPTFASPGGNVFGMTSLQWKSYFGAKADANNGVLCGPIIQNLPVPVNPNDPATKQYADSVSQGVYAHAPVSAATTASIGTAPIYANGSGGVGATLTNSVPGVLVVDTYTPAYGERILLKDQANPATNGVYVLSTVGTASVPWQLTRVPDFNQAATHNIATQAYFFVLNGTAAPTGNKNIGYVLLTQSPIVVGVTPLSFGQFLAAPSYVPFVGDSGIGGVVGLVPAPAAGTGVLNDVLSAAGGFIRPSLNTVLNWLGGSLGVANNTALAAFSTGSGGSILTRDGFAASGDAPPLHFKSETGTCASNGRVNDGGSCVNAGDGGSWVAIMGPTALPEEFGADRTGTSDSSSAISAAAATCRPVELSVTYLVLHPMVVCSAHPNVFGHGASTGVKLGSGFDVTQHTTCSATSDGATWRAIFYNPNCGGAVHTYTDTDAEYADFKIDATAVSGASVATIAIFSRNVNRLYVHGITCDGFADCTATLASTDTSFVDDVALHNYNAGFDFWDSPLNATVINTTVYCSSTGIFGLLFNASDTTATHDGTGVNYKSIGNKQYGCGEGWLIDPLTSGGLIQNISIIDDLDDALSVSGISIGVQVGGNVQGGQIVAPVLKNFATPLIYPALYVGPSLNVPGETGNPTGISVLNPKFINVSVASGGVAPLALKGSATNRATGVDLTVGNTYPYAVDVDTTGTLIEGRLPAGTSGLANVHSSFPQINNLNYQNVTSLGTCGSGATVSGISSKMVVTPGTGGTTSCTVNFPTGVWATGPYCLVTSNTAGHGDIAAGPSTTSAVSLHSTTAMDSVSITLLCFP